MEEVSSGGDKDLEIGVRIIHKDSGAVGEARDSRHQHQNKKSAFRRLIDSDKFQKWLKLETAKQLTNKKEMEQRINRAVEEAMKEENIKVEYLGNEEV